MFDFLKKKEEKVEAVAEKAEAVVEEAKAATSDFAKAENVFVGETFASKDEALTFISAKAVELGIAGNADELKAAYLAREEEGNTALMQGFAIPHAKADTVNQASVMVVKSAEIPDWVADMDGSKVQIAIALLIPTKEAGTTHLTILSKIAAALMDDQFRADITSATDAATIAAKINERLGD